MPHATKEARAEYDKAYRARNSKRFRAYDHARHLTHGHEKYESQKERRPWATILYAAKMRANRLGLKCDIDSQWAESKWTGKCEITGLSFCAQNNEAKPFSPSIDRIIPSLGYTQNNCRFILFGINAMKGSCVGDFEVNAIAKAIVKKKQEDFNERLR